MDTDGPDWSHFPGTYINNSCFTNSTYPAGVRHYVYTVYAHKLWYGMLFVGLSILTLYALLAGITLAVCGPEMTWLQLRSITGTTEERKRARIVARMRRHSSWMLCSLIICTVACAESIPFIIQGLWAEPAHAQWVPILISTLIIALCAEILPQYFIPRNPIEWAYFFWPVIYSCMCITGIISWPLGWILDNFGGKPDKSGIFTNGEMVSLIKYHERSESNGGMIGHDAARVMTGALLLDSRQVGGEICSMPVLESNHDKDMEKANIIVFNGMITRWSDVKTVDIDEAIDASFLFKLKSWSFSRIPVTGTCTVDNQPTGHSTWEGREIFGFLHLKSLVGLEIKDSSKLFVRDLPIYPLPIIQEDMPAYQVLNIFQLGMARMAIVVPKPLKNGQVLTLSANNFDIVNRFQTPCWAPIEQATSRVISSSEKSDENTNWATDVLASTGNEGEENATNARKESQKVVGIRCPKPVGIVTFEDIVNVILQKPTRLSIDFYNGGTMTGTIKRTSSAKRHENTMINPVRTDNLAIPTFNCDPGVEAIPLYIRNNSTKKRPVSSYLRKRNISNKGKPVSAMDGANETSFELTSLDPRAKQRSTSGGSAYTQNSRGGFHNSASARTVMPTPMGLDGADERSLDRIHDLRLVASNVRPTETSQASYRHSINPDSQGNATSEDTVHDAMDLTQQLLAELGEDRRTQNSTEGTARSCSLPSRTALALSRSGGPTIPWARRYVSVAAPTIAEFKRESYSSLERFAGHQPVKYKLNPSAPVFKVTSPSGHERSTDQNTIYSDVSFSVNKGYEQENSSSAPSISSSFHRRSSWLYNASKVSKSSSVEGTEMLDWFAIRNQSGKFTGHETPEPYNGDPNSTLFDGPIRTPCPSDDVEIPADLLRNMMRRNDTRILHKSETLPYIRGGRITERKSSIDGSLNDDNRGILWFEGENQAGSSENLITAAPTGIRRASFWI